MDRSKLKTLAKKRLDGRVIISFAFILIVEFVFLVLSMLPLIGFAATLILSGPITLSLTYVFYKIIVKDKSPELEDIMFGFADDNFLRSFVGWLMYQIFTFLWSLLLIVPGIIKSISYSQMFYLMIDNPKLDADAAMKKSMKLMDGHKMDYFVLELSFIPWYLLCMITFGIAYIYVGPYVSATKAAFYRDLVAPKTVIKDKVEKVKKEVTKVKKDVEKEVKKVSKEVKKGTKKISKDLKKN